MSDHRPRGPVVEKVPAGDDRLRLVCDDCGFIHYRNPKIIVGAICTWAEPGGSDADEKFLLVRRAIEPRRGFWAMPAGYMELGESTDAGAAREVWEEAEAKVRLDGLLAIYDLPGISQVHLIYRGRMTTPDHAAGVESLEARLFRWDDLPWDDMAYPTVAWALHAWRRARGQTIFAPDTVPPSMRAEEPFASS